MDERRGMPGAVGIALVLSLLTACSGGTSPSSSRGSSPSPSPSARVCPPGIDESNGLATGVPVPMCKPVTNQGSVDLTSKGTTVSLTMKVEFPSFTPTFITIARGATVTLTLVNQMKPTDFQPDHTFTSDVLHVSQEIPHGTTKTVTFTLPTNGQPVRFYCIPHARAGQQGAFVFA